MRLYTRRGDNGETGLLGGARVLKSDPRVNAYGAVDELQAHLGLTRTLIDAPQWVRLVRRLQQHLFIASARLAAIPAAAVQLTARIGDAEVTWLESQIDRLTARHGLPNGFIMPGESAASAAVHVARTVCRRCEREILPLVEPAADDLADLVVYFNRLSDLLFALAWSLEVRDRIRTIVSELLVPHGNGDARCR